MNECTFSYADGHKCSEKAAPELKPGLCGKHQRWTLKYGKKEHMMANDPRLEDAEAQPYKTACAWCKRIMQDGPQPDSQVSHGICPECLAKMEKDLNMNLHKNEAQMGKVLNFVDRFLEDTGSSDDADRK